MKISKTKALEVLRTMSKRAEAIEYDTLEVAALDFAIESVELRRDYAKFGAMGGKARGKNLSAKELSDLDKLGGRPQIKKPGYMTLKKRESRARQKSKKK